MLPASPYLMQTGIVVVAAVLLVTIAASLLTLTASTFLLWRYRRKIATLMSAEGGRDDRGEAHRPSDRTLPSAARNPAPDGSRTKSLAETLFGQMKASPLRQAGLHAIAGLVFGVVLASAAFVAFSQTGMNYLSAARHPLQFALLLWTFLWPVVLTTNIVSPGTRRSRLLRVFLYFVVLTLIGWWLVWTPTEPAVLIGGIVIPAWYGETPLRVVTRWAVANVPPTVLILTFRYRRLRAVAPLVLGFMTVVSIGVLGIVAAAFIYQESSVAIMAWAAQTLNVSVRTAFVGYFLLLCAAACLLFGLLGWILEIWIRRGYRRKTTSDQSLAVDALMAIFASLYAMLLAPAGPAWSLAAVAAFVAYKFVIILGNRWLGSSHRRGGYQPALLVLRVFSLGHRSEVLFDAVTKRWRHVGHVRLIAGMDLALSTIAPHQFLAFVTGKLEQLFISSESAIERALMTIDTQRDRDGRFRINDLFCRADTWQRVLQRLIPTTDVVLMDLRSLTTLNAGCVFEIKELLNTKPLEQLVFVTDDQTDKTFLDATLQQASHELRLDSPNRAASMSALELFDMTSASDSEIARLVRRLCGAAAHSHLTV